MGCAGRGGTRRSPHGHQHPCISIFQTPLLETESTLDYGHSLTQVGGAGKTYKEMGLGRGEMENHVLKAGRGGGPEHPLPWGSAPGCSCPWDGLFLGLGDGDHGLCETLGSVPSPFERAGAQV